MGNAYDLIITANSQFAASRIVLSGVLRRRDVSWQRIGATNDRLEWVASTLRVTFVDPNCWVDDWDYGGDGLHITQRGARYLGQLYLRICEVGGDGQGTRSKRPSTAETISSEVTSGRQEGHHGHTCRRAGKRR